jgi:hypothetical protein
MVYNFISQYWGLISMFLGGVVYVATHYNVALGYAKKKAIVLMLSAEANAEQLSLANGQEKFNWVISHGYDLLPSNVRLFVSKPLFCTVVQSLFDQALAFAKAHESVKPVVVPSTQS